jgi:hypothetical protein
MKDSPVGRCIIVIAAKTGAGDWVGPAIGGSLGTRSFGARIDKILHWNNNGFVVILSQCFLLLAINDP